MSATIDERVVELKFNNSDFEQNAKTSISTIDRLKQALNFTTSSRGLDEVQNAVKKVDMKGLGDAVEGVKVKFSALQVAAISALNNIVNKAVNAGTQIAKAFTLGPITQGFNEYELKMGSIQTILANTQSQTAKVSQDSIKEVNTAAEQAAVKSEELNQQAIENLQKRNEAETKALEKSSQAQLRALEKSQKKQTKALQKSQKNATKALDERHKAELEKVEEAEEKKQEALAESQEKQLDALNDTYQRQVEALEAETQQELEIVRQAHQQKLDMYNEEYMSKLKSADEDRYNQIKAIEDEIDSLKNLTKAEKKARDESAKQEKLNSLKALRNKVETQDEREYVEKQISDYEAELEEERAQEARENRIDELEEQKKNINEAFNATKEALQAEYKENVENENNIYQSEVDSINKTQEYKLKAAQETYKKELESLQKRQAAETKALQKKQKEEIDAINKKQQKESEALSERQQNESDALNERQQDARQALSDRQQSEKEALSERQAAEMTAMSERHQTELENIESEKSARLNALNDEAAKNVKPTTLKDVTKALDELNTYADKTIYNFADMTRNIGTFTAAGVDLDTSVKAIKGIANLAAVSGSSSQQASTAMYQLSQAIATGTVKLMDWNSVVNAGMGGKTFQNSLIETARVHDVAIDDMIAKNGSFRDSLQEGWLTSDILLETLSKFTGDLTEEQLKSMGYTEDQIADIVKMGETAVDAATKVRTWTQLLDTTKEAMGSGWAQTFEIIFGNFNSATALWTKLSDYIGGIINDSANERNKMLLDWKNAGGRNAAIQTFINLWNGLLSVLKPIQEAFRNVFPKTTGTQLANLTKSLRDFTSRLKLSDTASENLKNTFSGLFSLVDLIGKGFKAVFNILKPGTGVITNLAGGFLDITGKLGEWITAIDESATKGKVFTDGIQGIKDAVAAAFDVINGFVTAIRNFVSTKFKMPDVSFISNFSKSIETGTKPLETFLNLIKTGFTEASKVLGKVAPVFKKLISPITNLFKGGMGLEDAVNILAKGTLTVAISKFILDLSGLIKKAKKAFDPLKNIAKEIRNTFGALQNQINSKALINVAAAIAILVGSLILLSKVPEDDLKNSLGAITGLFIELVAVLKVLTSSDSKSVKSISATLLAMSASLLLLAKAVKQIAGADVDKMVAAGAVIGALLYEVTTIAEKLANTKSKNPGEEIKVSALALIGMATAVLILSKAVKELAGLKPAELAKGGGAVAAALGLIALISKASEKGGFKFTNGAGILAMAASMLVFQKAVEGFGKMDINQLKQGGIAVGALIGVLAAFEAIAGVAEHGFGSSAGVLLVATALIVLLKPLKELGNMKIGTLVQGLIAIGAALAEFAIAVRMMDATKDSALAIAALTAALAVLAPVLKILGSLGLPGLIVSLTALAGTFVVMGTAAAVLNSLGLVPTLNNLAKAVAILGVGMFGIGAGVAAFALGLTMLAGSGAAAAAALITIVKSLVVGVLEALNESIPLIIDTIKKIVLGLLQAIGETVPQTVESLYNIVTQVLSALTQYLPDIIEQLVTFLTNVINALGENLPDLVQAVVNLFMEFFASIIEALKNMDTETLENGILGIGLIAGLMTACAALSGLAASAMTGLAEVGAFVAELSALIAAAGAIAQIPGFTWLITEGGNALQLVGTAIGQFVGGILGGFLKGASDTLPEVGTNLTNFMNNMAGFLSGVENINSSKLDAVTNLVGIVKTMSGAEEFVMSGDFGVTLNKFADELKEFGPKVKEFSDSIAGIDTTAVQTAASAASIMNEVANNLPKSGGFWQDIVGTPKTLATFGRELASFGPSIKSFSDSVAGGVDEAAVTSAANAASIMNEVATKLPKTGGYWQKFFGETKSLAVFGAELVAFGPSIKAYSDTVSGGIDEGAVTASANAASALSEVANNLPKSGGYWQTFFGEQNFETFGSQLEKFGESMKKYSDKITEGNGFNESAVTASANAGKALAELANTIPKSKGALSFLTGKDDISGFGEKIKSFGTSMSEYYNSVSAINTSQLTLVISAVNDLVDLANNTKDLDTSGLKGLAKNLKKLADNGITAFQEAFTGSQEKVNDAINTMIGYAKSKLKDSQDGLSKSGKDAGKKAASGLSSGMEGKKKDIKQTVSDLVKLITDGITSKLTKETFKPAGNDAMSGLNSGISGQKVTIETTVQGICDSISSILSRNLASNNFTTMGSNVMTGVRNGMVTHENGYGSARSSASSLASGIHNAISNGLPYSNFYIIGSNVGVGLANGLNSMYVTVANAAARLAAAAAQATAAALQVASPSKLTTKYGEYFGQGLVNGITSMTSAVATSGTDLGNTAITPLQAALSALNDDLENDSEFNPVITPTLDLSNVNDGAGRIASMFNGGLNLGTSMGLAQMASSGFAVARGTVSTTDEDRVESKLDDLIKKTDEEKQNVTYNNTFNIRSTDPRATANEVDQILQHRVERRNAVWAK